MATGLARLGGFVCLCVGRVRYSFVEVVDPIGRRTWLDDDDGGFTGANMDRPALQRLLADIEAGQIDCVVVYKVDRLSRSLLDFARMMQTFDKHRVSFVSVT